MLEPPEEFPPTPTGNAMNDFRIGVFLIRVIRVIRGEFGAGTITCCVLSLAI